MTPAIQNTDEQLENVTAKWLKVLDCIVFGVTLAILIGVERFIPPRPDPPLLYPNCPLAGFASCTFASRGTFPSSL